MPQARRPLRDAGRHRGSRGRTGRPIEIATPGGGGFGRARLTADDVGSRLAVMAEQLLRQRALARRRVALGIPSEHPARVKRVPAGSTVERTGRTRLPSSECVTMNETVLAGPLRAQRRPGSSHCRPRHPGRGSRRSSHDHAAGVAAVRRTEQARRRQRLQEDPAPAASSLAPGIAIAAFEHAPSACRVSMLFMTSSDRRRVRQQRAVGAARRIRPRASCSAGAARIGRTQRLQRVDAVRDQPRALRRR